MRIALGQINTTVGDLRGNADRMIRAAREAVARGAEVVVFPELSLTGYPPRDLVEKDSFLERTQQELERLTAETADLDAVIVAGYVGRADSDTGKKATNSAALIERGSVIFRQNKMLLPTYDVFDEARYFCPGDHANRCTWCDGGRPRSPSARTPGTTSSSGSAASIDRDPVEELARPAPSVLISINASPYHMGKRAAAPRDLRATPRSVTTFRSSTSTRSAATTQLVFDGSSFAMDATGRSHRLRALVSRGPGHRGYRDRLRRPARRIFPTSAKPSMRRWCSARATTSASADSNAS